MNNETTTEQYRFDDSYESVYEYNGESYEYICNYFSADIKPKNKEATKINKIEEWKNPGLAEHNRQMNQEW